LAPRQRRRERERPRGGAGGPAPAESVSGRAVPKWLQGPAPARPAPIDTIELWAALSDVDGSNALSSDVNGSKGDSRRGGPWEEPCRAAGRRGVAEAEADAEAEAEAPPPPPAPPHP